MNKISKDKRNRLILVGAITAIVIAALWFLVIGEQQDTLAEMASKSLKLTESISKAEGVIKTQASVEQSLAEHMEALQVKENEMAPEDDPYAWMLDVMNRFCQGRQIVWTLDKPEFRLAEVVPGFSYKTAVFHFKATAFFNVIGKFSADFENTYRLSQIRSVSITPVGGIASVRAGAAPASDDETLAVEFFIVTPVRPTDAQSHAK